MTRTLMNILLFASWYHSGVSNRYTKSTNLFPGSNDVVEDDGPCLDDGKPRLYRWDPVKVGHVREVHLVANQTHKMVSMAIHPPIFEIPDFLSSEECDHIVNLAKERGMYTSSIHLDPLNERHLKAMRSTEGHSGQSNGSSGSFLNWDTDKNYEITIEEIKIFAEKFKYIVLEDEDINEMAKNLEIKELEDGIIDYQEWQSLRKRTKAIDMYLNDLKENHPHHRDRYSNQVWINQGRQSDNILRRLRERILKLTRLPKHIVYGGEPLQVVGYDKRGHYNAHYDGSRKADFPKDKCCHFDVTDNASTFCRLCRYITVMYYLNDVEEGGETAFPVADIENFNETDYRWRKTGDRYNLNKYCHSSKLVVTPEKGKAIMWYNFLPDDKTGWMGVREDRSLHGGCDVRKGEKYIANNWLPAPEADSAHLKSDYFDPAELADL